MYKCPNCNGELKYDITTAAMRCDYCGSSIEINDFKKTTKPALEEMHTFRCPQCGGEIYTNENAMAGYCMYCESETMIPISSENIKVPAKITPFQLTKAACEHKFLDYAKKMPFVPKEYLEEERQLDFRGIYIPFHIYHVEVDGNVTYRGKMEHTVNPGRREKQVDIYDVDTQVYGEIRNIPHDASELFLDHTSEQLISSRGRSVNFHPAYLSGFYGDLADSPEEKYVPYAEAYAQKTLHNRIRMSVRRNTGKSMDLTEKRKDIAYRTTSGDDVLKPVWFMSRKTGDRISYSVINGVSGEMTADLPVDYRKLFLCSAVVSAILFILLNMFVTLRPATMTELAMIFNIAVMAIYRWNIRQMYVRECSVLPKEKKKKFHWEPAYGIALALLSPVILILLMIVWIIIESFSGTPRAVFWCVLTAAFFFSALDMRKELAKHRTTPTKTIFLALLIQAFLAWLLITKPVDDLWYYTGGLISLLLMVLILYRIIRDYNLLCSQPMPQFRVYRGGNDSEDN